MSPAPGQQDELEGKVEGGNSPTKAFFLYYLVASMTKPGIEENCFAFFLVLD